MAPSSRWYRNTKESALSTTGHIDRSTDTSLVTRKLCHAPVATYAHTLVSRRGSFTPLAAW